MKGRGVRAIHRADIVLALERFLFDVGDRFAHQAPSPTSGLLAARPARRRYGAAWSCLGEVAGVIQRG